MKPAGLHCSIGLVPEAVLFRGKGRFWPVADVERGHAVFNINRSTVVMVEDTQLLLGSFGAVSECLSACGSVQDVSR